MTDSKKTDLVDNPLVWGSLWIMSWRHVRDLRRYLIIWLGGQLSSCWRPQCFWNSEKLRPDHVERGLLDFWSVIGRCLPGICWKPNHVPSSSCKWNSVAWEAGPMVVMSGQHYISRVLSLVLKFDSALWRFGNRLAVKCILSNMHPQGDFSFQHLRHGWRWQPQSVGSGDCSRSPSWFAGFCQIDIHRGACALMMIHLVSLCLICILHKWVHGEIKDLQNQQNRWPILRNPKRSQYSFSIGMLPIRWEASSKALGCWRRGIIQQIWRLNRRDQIIWLFFQRIDRFTVEGGTDVISLALKATVNRDFDFWGLLSSLFPNWLCFGWRPRALLSQSESSGWPTLGAGSRGALAEDVDVKCRLPWRSCCQWGIDSSRCNLVIATCSSFIKIECLDSLAVLLLSFSPSSGGDVSAFWQKQLGA